MPQQQPPAQVTYQGRPTCTRLAVARTVTNPRPVVVRTARFLGQQKQVRQVVHKKHKAVDNNNNHNSHNLHLQGATETNHTVKAQTILKVVGNQVAAITVRRSTPVRATAKTMVAAAVMVATAVATAVGIAVSPAGVLLFPTAARRPTKTSTGVLERKFTKRKNSKFHHCRNTPDPVPGKTQCSKT